MAERPAQHQQADDGADDAGDREDRHGQARAARDLEDPQDAERHEDRDKASAIPTSARLESIQMHRAVDAAAAR